MLKTTPLCTSNAVTLHSVDWKRGTFLRPNINLAIFTLLSSFPYQKQSVFARDSNRSRGLTHADHTIRLQSFPHACYIRQPLNIKTTRTIPGLLSGVGPITMATASVATGRRTPDPRTHITQQHTHIFPSISSISRHIIGGLAKSTNWFIWGIKEALEHRGTCTAGNCFVCRKNFP